MDYRLRDDVFCHVPKQFSVLLLVKTIWIVFYIKPQFLLSSVRHPIQELTVICQYFRLLAFTNTILLVPRMFLIVALLESVYPDI